MQTRSVKQELIEELGLTAFVVPVTLLLWSKPGVVTILMVLGSAVAFVLWHTRQDVIAYCTGVLIGFIADYLCTSASFYTFTAANMEKLPSWAPICWGYLYLLFLRGSGTAHRIAFEGWLGAHERVRKVIVGLIQIVIVLYVWETIANVDRRLSATIAVVLILSARCWHTERDLFMFLIAGLSGALAEASAIRLGIWSYPGYYFNSFIKLPISIPIVYGAIGVLVYRASTLGVKKGGSAELSRRTPPVDCG